ncbi:MAG: imelysin family protein [Pseudomonadales bacterium]
MALAVMLSTTMAVAAVNEREVVENYANLAHATYEDALITALALQKTTDALLAAPSEKALKTAQQTWKQARIPYQQSEVFRFGNVVVDDWEGQLNAWPLDEGLIDYVASDYSFELGNEGAEMNIIASTELNVGGEIIDTSVLTPELLASLNELAGSEANVATGYHAIEFLLWGQDLNGTNAGAGERPYTDYMADENCTGGHCERRADYLRAAVQLLVDDLTYMENQWAAGQTNNYRVELLSSEPQEGLDIMLFGMGSLALGELAGERLKVSLEANSPEDEHDCFSDNTHNSHFYNAHGIRNVYFGSYQRINGAVVEGASLSDLVRAKDTQIDEAARAAFDVTTASFEVMVESAEQLGMKYDQMIAEGNEAGQKIIRDAIHALVAETRAIEGVARVINVNNLQPDTAGHDF